MLQSISSSFSETYNTIMVIIYIRACGYLLFSPSLFGFIWLIYNSFYSISFLSSLSFFIYRCINIMSIYLYISNDIRYGIVDIGNVCTLILWAYNKLICYLHSFSSFLFVSLKAHFIIMCE